MRGAFDDLHEVDFYIAASAPHLLKRWKCIKRDANESKDAT